MIWSLDLVITRVLRIMALPPSSPVPKRRATSYREFFREFGRSQTPVVLQGATEEWGAHDKWGIDWLAESLGDKMVDTGRIHYGFGPDPSPKPKSWRDLCFEISAAETRQKPYLIDCSIVHSTPELLCDLQPAPECWGGDRKYSKLLPKHWRAEFEDLQLIVGGANAGFPVLHYDDGHVHAFITQVVGTKRFLLFPPDCGDQMYPTEDRRNVSQIRDAFNVDLEEHPKFAQAKRYEVDVAPGETVFVPAGWWHVTRASEANIAVSMNTVTPSNWWSWFNDVHRKSRGPVRWIKKSYFTMVGTLLDIEHWFRVQR